ncbi:hypothetical protein [Enterobacter sp. ECC-019]|uniref:hypothetical protein n=1 Tax=Enterobacter sp. ECC-019 TaxID=3116478 RepID=UPI0037543F57
MFQRLHDCGGGFWLGRIYDDCFLFEFERPVSLNDGMAYMITVGDPTLIYVVYLTNGQNITEHSASYASVQVAVLAAKS